MPLNVITNSQLNRYFGDLRGRYREDHSQRGAIDIDSDWIDEHITTVQIPQLNDRCESGQVAHFNILHAAC